MEYKVRLYVGDQVVTTAYPLSMQAEAFAHAKQYADAGKRFTLSLEE